MLTIKEISNLDGLRQMEKEWSCLLEESGSDNMFLSFDWILTWWKYFSKGNRLFILKVMDGGQAIGIAPLMISNRPFFGLPARVVRFMGTVISDRMDFILKGAKKECIRAILDYIMKNSSYWDYVDLEEMPDTTGNFCILRECIKELNFHSISGDDAKSFCISFENMNKEDFFRAFSRNTRRRLKKASHIFTRIADSEFEFKRFINTNGNGVSLDNLISEMERIEKMSWKGKTCAGIFLNKNTKLFHEEIVKRYFKKGLIEISFLSVKDRNIAYQYNYFYNSRIYSYSTAYDTRYASLSPGFALMTRVLENCIDSRIDEFDFLRGEEEWKKRLTSDYKIHARTRIFSRRAYSRFLFIIQSYILPRLKNKKTIYRTWMKFKEAAHVFKRRH